MRNLKNIVLLMFLCCLWVDNANSQKVSAVIQFGLIADIQYGNCDTNGSRFYRNSLEKLSFCVADLNSQEVQFTINLGDLVDRNPEDIDSVLHRLKQLDAKVYNTTGNHDYGGITNNKSLFRKLNMPKEYYSFKKDGWLFILLNTNEIASYANITGTWKEKELAAMLERIKTSNRNNGQDWNGGISSRQLEWFRKQLETAQKKGEKVLVFSHHPIYPASGFTTLNDQEILDVIAGYPCVKCVISGHHHTGAFDYYNNVPYITTEGMIETRENAYGIVAIFENEIVLTGIGRTKSYRIPFK